MGEQVEADRSNANNHLRSIVERIERLEEEKATIADDIKDVYAEAKGAGFDPKAIRIVVRRRKQDKAALEEQDAVVQLYLSSLEGTPLGDWASRKREESK